MNNCPGTDDDIYIVQCITPSPSYTPPPTKQPTSSPTLLPTPGATKGPTLAPTHQNRRLLYVVSTHGLPANPPRCPEETKMYRQVQ